MTHFVRENETGNQDFTLSDENGVFNGTGGTVALVLKDRSGATLDMAGKADWLVAALGTVRVQPVLGDLLADRGPYSAAFIVTVGGKTYSFPSQAPDVWKVWK